MKGASLQEFNLNALKEASVFYSSGITPAFSDSLRSVTRALLQAARLSNTLTAFDLNYRSKLWSHQTARKTHINLFDYIDIL